MDRMHDQDDALNIKVILLGVGGAAAAALLLALARQKDEKTPEVQIEDIAARAEDMVVDVKSESKKAAKAAKKKRKELTAAAEEAEQRVASAAGDVTGHLEFDAKAAERDLKAAAWDAQQEAKEAESRLRAAGHRVVDDATQLASRFGAEARNLAGEGKEKIAHLRHREETGGAVDDEVERLRAEVEDLKEQLSKAGRRMEKDYRGLTSRFSGKSGPLADVMASQATAAALEQIERALRAKAPALLAARNRAQVMDILQKELGSTVRDTAVQAAVAALAKWESGRLGGDAAETARDRARQAAEEARNLAHEIGDAARERLDHATEEVRDASAEAAHDAESMHANGKRRLWWGSKDVGDTPAAVSDEAIVESVDAAKTEEPEEEGHRGKAGLFWSGAGIGLALYALLDEERRDKVLRFANEASVQVQELVRDLQGYDDEF
jgi:cell division septum initiation protein DivIVA